MRTSQFRSPPKLDLSNPSVLLALKFLRLHCRETQVCLLPQNSVRPNWIRKVPSRDHATTGSSSCNSHLKLHGGTHVLTHAAHGNPRGGLGRAAIYMAAVTLWPSLVVERRAATKQLCTAHPKPWRVCRSAIGALAFATFHSALVRNLSRTAESGSKRITFI